MDRFQSKISTQYRYVGGKMGKSGASCTVVGGRVFVGFHNKKTNIDS